jgi:hypothetical protein
MPTKLIATFAAALASLAAAQAAGANRPLQTSGRPGTAVIPQAICDVRPYVASHSLFLSAPAIYARDARRRLGNDTALVRWFILLTDANGATLQAHPYSGWGRATDARPATFTGQQAFTNLNRYNPALGQFIAHGLDVVVVWYNNARRRTGSARYRVSSFKIVQGEIEYPAGNCA